MVWPLSGRDRELALAAEVLTRRTPAGVLLAGAAGVGKTRLAHEITTHPAAATSAVVWVRACGSAASIPLGAFAPMLEEDVDRAGPQLLAAARAALVRAAGGRPLVLAVDDAHLLDDASAALVHQLVAAAEVFLVATVRTRAPAPGAVRALWKDELATLIELAPLTRPDHDALVSHVLAGPIDPHGGRRLWELSAGNPLFLRELVLHGRASGALVQRDGVWRWTGAASSGLRLSELVSERLSGLTPAQAGLVELLAVGEPLELRLLDDAERAPLDALLALEIAETARSRRRETVRLAHPLYGEVIRATLPTTRRTAYHGRLARGLRELGHRRREDWMRMAVWSVDASEPIDPALLVRGSDHAAALGDWPLAQRLALAAGDGFPARLAHARALAGSGQAERAAAELTALEQEPSADQLRARLAVAQAQNAFWGLADHDAANTALRRAETAIADRRLREELTALRIRLIGVSGRPREALSAARPLLEDPAAGEPARLHAALAVVEALLATGRTSAAASLAGEWAAVGERHRDDVPHAQPALMAMRCLSFWAEGRLDQAAREAAASHELELARRAEQNTALTAALQGLIWLERGRVRTALSWWQRSAAVLRDVDAVGMRPWALAGVAQAAAQAGERELAAAAAAELTETAVAHKGFEPQIAAGQAWSAAAQGEFSRAREILRSASETAVRRGQLTFAAQLFHHLARLGDPQTATDRLAPLVASLDGPFIAVAAAHARAASSRDGAALRGAAEQLAELGFLLAAAESAALAARLLRDAGRDASARSAAARADVWLAACEVARSPALVPAPAEELTPREHEIALLAASGLSSQEIADRLVLSVRTVDTHLQRTYRKLGIRRRDELAALIAH